MNFFKYQNYRLAGSSSQQSAQSNDKSFGDPRLGNSNVNLQHSINPISDEEWVKSWMFTNNITPYALAPDYQTPNSPSEALEQKNENPMALSRAKACLRHCFTVFDKISSIQEYLQDNMETLPTSEWKQKTKEVYRLKNEYLKMIARLETNYNLKELQRSITQRKKKRLNIQKRKELHREDLKLKIEEQRKAHKEIDSWLNMKREEVERQKVEEEMKKEADAVLSEVTKKKSEARKQLSLISALVKLRNCRESMATQRGENVSLEDRKVFCDTTNKLVDMWENSLKIYLKEEQGLKLMLEQNADEDTKTARHNHEKRLVDEWQNVLFGPLPSASNSNSTYWALTAADRDLDTFIAIRKSWDTFLVPETDESGSKIPIGWVLPDHNPSEAWSKYLG